MSRISPPITESMHSVSGFESYHRDDAQPLESPSSPMMPIPHLFRNQKTVDGNNNNNSLSKRMSDCGYPATAIKVDQPYQSYLNHPFTKLHQQQYSPPQDPNPQQRPQAYVNKYNSYTNSSKSIRLITIPSTSSALSSIEKSKVNNQMTALDSPTSPMVSPPPPYLHSDHGDGRFSPDSKKQCQSHHQQTSSQHGLQQPQWPSMMMLSSSAGVTTTAATVTRPKLARVLPPQAIPIVTSGLGISNLGQGPSSADATPLTATTPRPSRLMKMRMMDNSSVHMIEECLNSPVVAMQPSSILSATTAMGPMSLQSGSPSTFPGFWEEARLSKMHYVFLSFGLVMMGSAIWVLVMQVFLLEWATVMPATSLVLFGMQYSRYRWKRNRHNCQAKKNGEASASAAVVAAAAAAAAQLSSSYSSRESDAYLEPHQPRSFYATPLPQHHVTFQEEEEQQQQQQPFNQQAYQQPRSSQQQQQPSKKYPQHHQFRPTSSTPMSASPSSSSLVSVSSMSSSTSSSTSSSVSSMGQNKAMANGASPYYQSNQFLSPVDSPTTPPPAYFFKKMELPEIGSVVGDLVSEFEVDFSSIKY